MRGIDHELVEIAVAVDGDKAGQRAVLLRHDDRSLRHQIPTPALAPPVQPCREVDLRIGLLPGAMPELDRGGLVLWTVRAKVEGGHFTKVVMPGLVPGIHAFPSA